MFPRSFVCWKTLLSSLTMLVLITIASSLPIIQPASQILTTRFTTNIATASLISHNWAGYVATHGTFTSVTGTWIVPAVAGRNYSAADATWVGIGGLNRNDLIQSGTQNIVSRSGQVSTLAFFELLPDAGQQIPISIRSGDSVTVSLREYNTNQWRIAFQDNTNGQIYTKTVYYSSSLASAEWIEEAPSKGNKIMPLDKFGGVQFSGGFTTEDGNQVNIAQSNAQPIILINKNGRTLAAPSSLDSDGASFIITPK